jgi:hypothetical protein
MSLHGAAQTLGDIFKSQFPAPSGRTEAALRLRGCKSTSADIQIFFCRLTGASLLLDVEPSFTILQLKQLISIKASLPIDDLRLLFNNQQLVEDSTLSSNNIKAYSTVYEDCLDIPTLRDLYIALSGSEWLSSKRTHSNQLLYLKDQQAANEVKENTQTAALPLEHKGCFYHIDNLCAAMLNCFRKPRF